MHVFQLGQTSVHINMFITTDDVRRLRLNRSLKSFGDFMIEGRLTGMVAAAR